jgi:hypothetical protein
VYSGSSFTGQRKVTADSEELSPSAEASPLFAERIVKYTTFENPVVPLSVTPRTFALYFPAGSPPRLYSHSETVSSTTRFFSP